MFYQSRVINMCFSTPLPPKKVFFVVSVWSHYSDLKRPGPTNGVDCKGNLFISGKSRRNFIQFFFYSFFLQFFFGSHLLAPMGAKTCWSLWRQVAAPVPHFEETVRETVPEPTWGGCPPPPPAPPRGIHGGRKRGILLEVNRESDPPVGRLRDTET